RPVRRTPLPYTTLFRSWQTEVIPVRLDRVHDVAGEPGLLKHGLSVLRMTRRVTFVVVIVQETGERPVLLVPRVAGREAAHRCLEDRKSTRLNFQSRVDL